MLFSKLYLHDFISEINNWCHGLLSYFPHYYTHTPDDDELIVFQVNSKLWLSLFGHIKGPIGIQLYCVNHSYIHNVGILYIMHVVGGCGGIVNRWNAIYVVRYLRKVFEHRTKPLTVQAHRGGICVLIYIVFTSVAAIFYLIIPCAHCSGDERTVAISYSGITCCLSKSQLLPNHLRRLPGSYRLNLSIR